MVSSGRSRPRLSQREFLVLNTVENCNTIDLYTFIVQIFIIFRWLFVHYSIPSNRPLSNVSVL